MSKLLWIEQNLKPGEQYAGIIIGQDGEPDHHLILLPGQATNVKWDEARQFARQVGGELPTRREQTLLYVNLKSEFELRWYWSGEQRAINSDFAWIQHFSNGDQYDNRKSFEGRARAVRRLIIS